MDRNIILAYPLSFLKTAWFWLGIWILFYLKITNYAGIGLVETALFFTTIITEIPTGAFADLLGRKLSLLLSFIFQALCNFFIAFSFNLPSLIFSVILGGIGMSLYSGAFDALIFDSLKQAGKQDKFNKIISNTNSLQLLSMTICSTIGGFLYVIDPKLPFFATTLAYLIAAFLCIFLIEPSIDSEKFNLSNYLHQSVVGFKHIFQENIKSLTILLIIISSVYAIAEEMIDSFLGVEFGFNEKQLGILFALISIFAAVSSQFTLKTSDKNKLLNLILIVAVFSSLSFIVSPLVGTLFGALSLIIRNSLMTIHKNTASILLNSHIESKYRATSLSAFSMIKNIPYALSAFFLGSFMDRITAKHFSLYLGLFLLSAVLFQKGRRNGTSTLLAGDSQKN